jgi:serine/threonine-protein kinase SRPK3
MNSASPGEKSGYTPPEWLEEICFDGERNEDLTRKAILKVGKLVRSMLLFKPSKRALAKEILQDPWFKEKWSNIHIEYSTSAFVTEQL